MKKSVIYVVSTALLAVAAVKVANTKLTTAQPVAFRPGVGKYMEGPVPWPGKGTLSLQATPETSPLQSIV